MYKIKLSILTVLIAVGVYGCTNIKPADVTMTAATTQSILYVHNNIDEVVRIIERNLDLYTDEEIDTLATMHNNVKWIRSVYTNVSMSSDLVYAPDDLITAWKASRDIFSTCVEIVFNHIDQHSIEDIILLNRTRRHIESIDRAIDKILVSADTSDLDRETISQIMSMISMTLEIYSTFKD